MLRIGANDPCPCGSAKKYKRCCMGRQSGERAIPLGARTVERDGQRMLANAGVGDDDLQDAAADFEHEDRGRGLAQDLVEFAEPIMKLVDAPKKVETGFMLAQIFWNLALIEDEGACRMTFDEVFADLPQARRESMWSVALTMMERHREMFPDMHRHGRGTS